MFKRRDRLFFMLCSAVILTCSCSNTSVDDVPITVSSEIHSTMSETTSSAETASSFSEAEASEDIIDSLEQPSETETDLLETSSDEKDILQNSSTPKDTLSETTSDMVPESTENPTVSAETTVESQVESQTQPATTAFTTDSSEIAYYSSFFIAGNAAYEQYSYDDTLAGSYAAVINAAADALNGTANVYNIVVPLSISISLPDVYAAQINPADERTAISSLYSKMNSNVKTISIYDTLYAHKDEYLYFRTDHHWTALAAYYAYEQFCSVKGISANPLSGYKTITFDGFLGSFYSWSDNNPALGNTPDYVTSYYPLASSTQMLCENPEGSFQWPVINDVSSYQSCNKYAAFIGGDNAFTTITNAGLTDGSSCVVIKESFGNAFVPFLVDHYQTVYVIDFRTYTGKLSDFVKNNNIQDVIYVNSISMTRGSDTIRQLGSIL